VEVVAPVLARHAREQLWETLDVLLRDERQAWQMDPAGDYTQLRPRSSDSPGPESLGTHQTLLNLTGQRHARST
jgi:polyphosphate kinase